MKQKQVTNISAKASPKRLAHAASDSQPEFGEHSIYRPIPHLQWERAIRLTEQVCALLEMPSDELAASRADFETQLNLMVVKIQDPVDRAWLATEQSSRFLDTMREVVGALDRGHFGADLTRLMAMAGKRPARLALECSCEINRIQFWLKHAAVTGMASELAISMDRALLANGRLLASYVALNHERSFKPEFSIGSKLLGGTSFGQWLRGLRQTAGLSPKELGTIIKKDCGLTLSGSALNHYELDLFVPSRKEERLVQALDKALNATGNLIAAWEQLAPSELRGPSEEPPLPIPVSLLAEIQAVIADATRAPARWGATSCNMFEEFCVRFFRYLLDEGIHRPEELTLTMLCHWPLVQMHFEWLRDRVNRKSFTSYEETRTRTLISLYAHYFPSLWEGAVVHPFWSGQMPSMASAFDSDPKTEVSMPLGSSQVQWANTVECAKKKAQQFLKISNFQVLSATQRITPLLENRVPLHKLVAEVRSRVESLPGRILCRKAALQCRRLAVFGLMLARPFAPRAVVSLTLDQVKVTEGGYVDLLVPPALLRNGKTAGKNGIQGELPHTWDWLHTLIKRWIYEARPIVLGGQHSPYLFLSAPSGRKAIGGTDRMERARNCLYRDSLTLTGFNPSALRYLIVSDARSHHLSSHDIALLLNTTRSNVETIVQKLDALMKTMNAATTISKLTK